MVWVEAEEENFNLVVESMAMRIIENKEENHLDEVKWLFGESNKIVIVSPFLSKDAIQELGKILPAKISDVTMVTTLKPFDVDQFIKVKALMELNMLKKLRGCNLSIRIDNDLHGKVYIGRKDNQYVGCIITSANFTHKGMKQNHEWGVFVDNQDKIRQIHEQILGDATIELAEKDLMKMKQWIEDNQIEDVKSPTVDVSFIDMIEMPIVTKFGLTYWLKPLGKSPDPVPPTRLFGDEMHQITFSTKKPSGIAKGDILIAYSVVTQQLLSVFEATDRRGRLTSFSNPSDNQWPNYIWCKNLTPKYGSQWPQKNTTLIDLRTEFAKLYPRCTVVPSGNKLNGMQWGADHIRATKEFGEFVMRRMTGEI